MNLPSLPSRHLLFTLAFASALISASAQENRPPIATDDTAEYTGAPITILPLVNDTDPDGDPLEIYAAREEDRVGELTFTANSITYTPPAAFLGRGRLEYFIRDGRGGLGRGFIFIRTNQVITKVAAFAARGGAGDPVVIPKFAPQRLPAGTTLVDFGQPAASYGVPIFLATVREPGGALRQAILSPGESGYVVIAVTGDTPPGVPGARWQHFLEPAVRSFGGTFIASMRWGAGGVHPFNDEGVWDSTRLIAREGTLAVGAEGARFVAFTAVAERDGAQWFTARLGGHGVTSHNDEGLWARLSFTNDGTDGRLVLVLREGAPVLLDGAHRVVRSFAALAPSLRSPAQERHSSSRGIIVRLDLADGATLVADLGFEVTTPVALSRATSGDTLDGLVVERFGLPAGSFANVPSGAPGRAAFRAETSGGQAVFVVRDTAAEALAVAGELAPGLDGASFRGFSDPVMNFVSTRDNDVAFLAHLTGDASGTALYWNRNGENVLVAREGAPAPATASARIGRVDSFVLPPSIFSVRGPVFTAPLLTLDQPPRDALWSTDAAGTPQLIVREGVSIVAGGATRTIRRLDALPMIRGARSGARTYDPIYGNVLVTRVVFTDSTQALLRTLLP